MSVLACSVNIGIVFLCVITMTRIFLSSISTVCLACGYCLKESSRIILTLLLYYLKGLVQGADICYS